MSLNGDWRERAATVAGRLADALFAPPAAKPGGDRASSDQRWRGQSLAAGAAGVAVLHGIRARAGIGDWATVDAWLIAATREELSAGTGAGLWFGAPALAFALATAAAPGRYRSARQHLDTAVANMIERRLAAANGRINAGQRPERAEYDLVRGLTGLGAHLLTSRPDAEQLRRILAYLVRLSEPLPTSGTVGLTLPGWWNGDLPVGASVDAFADGHADLGMAHGIAGPLALLALAYRRGIVVPGHLDALNRMCDWLDSWRQDSPTGPWWPEKITLSELTAGRPVQAGPGRASWCYGTPGLARAQQLAAIALTDMARQERAEAALAGCLSNPAQLVQFVDPTLCHGWAGLLTTVHRAAADARFHPLGNHLPALTDQLLGSLDAAEPASRWPPGLIEGTAGIAAVLHSLTIDTTATWETALLLGLPQT
ncbi:lanthionine synthetase C family protein [Frankia sp. QA3]|uniref:lanthionine synthetase C family protein n=1 Tax=Frankia sp. QA3 TaxID=710111 RepID=UPI000269C466|nr:lanthionine synthetase C family protein [Frankia sp. QA3]EIV93875.1 Lanthionine synthetase C-like protein [Frankia sp. QA3]